MIATFLLFFLGTVFTMGSFWTIYVEDNIKNNGLKTEAELTSIDNSADRGYAYFTFTDINGNLFEVQSNSNLPTFSVGDKTTIYYDPKNPSRYFHLDSDSTGNFIGIIAGLFLLACAIFRLDIF